jgi:predicted short-subunit dehydrogenase-like oxidoreductase (DUF2520 family)
MECGISIIGAGRIGRALGRRLRENGWKIHAVVTRSAATARRSVRSIGGGHGRADISGAVFAAPVILIAVPDAAIGAAAQKLASFGCADLHGKIILHTSGALGSEALSALRPAGAYVGSIHPLQTFNGIGIPPLDGTIFVIEGDARAVRTARSITRALGGHVVRLQASEKPRYHAAAVISAGHVLAMEEAAVQLFASLGMKRQEALRALVPLTRQVLENLERVGPRAAWTGPLPRGDYDVIAKHEEAMKGAPSEFLDAYRAVNRLAARVLASDPEEVLGELRKISTN